VNLGDLLHVARVHTSVQQSSFALHRRHPTFLDEVIHLPSHRVALRFKLVDGEAVFGADAPSEAERGSISDDHATTTDHQLMLADFNVSEADPSLMRR
jgi:hypothetical protein